jgi:hypothetical protein
MAVPSAYCLLPVWTQRAAEIQSATEEQPVQGLYYYLSLASNGNNFQMKRLFYPQPGTAVQPATRNPQRCSLPHYHYTSFLLNQLPVVTHHL